MSFPPLLFINSEVPLESLCEGQCMIMCIAEGCNVVFEHKFVYVFTS